MRTGRLRDGVTGFSCELGVTGILVMGIVMGGCNWGSKPIIIEPRYDKKQSMARRDSNYTVSITRMYGVKKKDYVMSGQRNMESRHKNRRLRDVSMRKI
jgi:hypothetical protein